MLMLVLGFILATVVLLWAYVRIKSRRFMKYSEMIPGPKCLPILGNCLEFRPNDPYIEAERLVDKYGKIVRIWLGPYLTIAISDPDYIEVLLSSNTQITKSMMYNSIRPWLGEGLLTSTGEHWRSHRKLLTPAFHFKILEQFVDVFNKNGNILLDKLRCHVGGPEFDVTFHMNLCALDNIAETAMGVVVDAQNGNHSDYVQAVHSMAKITMDRIFRRPWLLNDFMFGLTTSGKTFRKDIRTLHNFTNAVIKTKRESFIKESKDKGVNDLGIKKRSALLDLMIEASDDGVHLSDEQIRAEVDTFMFEGHDTTTSALCMTVWCLSRDQFVQDKACAELRDIFGDSDRDASYSDLQNMRYLEMVVKETLRLYPSVPLYGRRTTQELKMGDYTIPAGCEIGVLPYKTHRRPEHFPDPDKFDPDRFLPENCVGRHPFAYVPFSAGPRNCIGQKFAMLEIKSTISKILRKFKILPSDSTEEIEFVADFVLKTAAGVFIKLRPRTEDMPVL